MAANIFNTIRKSYLVNLLFTSILSNLVVFAQPLQQLTGQQAITESRYHNATSVGEDGMELPEKQDLTKDTVMASPPDVAGALSYPAIETAGVIGKTSNFDSENPVDNFFRIVLPEGIKIEKYNALLAYDLYGLSGASETTKSINNNPSYGGKVISKSEEWISVKELLSTSQLKPGSNEIFFNRRTEENYLYEIRNLKIELQEKKGQNLLFSEKSIVNNEGKLYVVGIAPENLASVNISGEEVPVVNGVFEHIISNLPKNSKQLRVSLGNKNLEFPIIYQEKASTKEFSQSPMANPRKTFSPDMLLSDNAQYEGMSIKIGEVPASKEGVRVLVEGLGFKDVRVLDAEVENVTAGSFPGYRLNRISVPDSIPVQLRLKYDAGKIPDGYTARDIRTFYFDPEARSWKGLAVDSLDMAKNEVISTVLSEGTDYINGVIKVPESPETGSFAPTAMNDIKYADPAAGVVSIAPPSPNNSGTVNTSFPLKLPQGRNGMSPSLAVSYNSEAGNGWMGIGWNLSTQAITLNTTWGAPQYSLASETEIYSMNGSDLVLLLNGGSYTSPHRDANILRTPERSFFERKEGSYQKIVRHGNSPKNYWWEVTDKQGNKTFYGGYNGVANAAVLKDAAGNIGHWAITRTEDPFGNYIEYSYSNTNATIPGSAVPAKEFYIESIKYAKNSGVSTPNYYQVDFKRDSYTVGTAGFQARQDASINARNGYIQLTDELLTEVHVSFVQSGSPTRIRAYRFDYANMPFQKKQLSKISEFDKDNSLFYSNTMEYFNDIGTNNIISGSQTSWGTAGTDILTSPLALLAGSNTGIIPNGSLLGTSVSSGTSFGVRIGFGLGGNIKSVINTIGGSFNYSTNSQDAKISFMDINGDGLPDKIFNSGDRVYYRYGYRSDSGNGFGEKFEVDDLSRLSRTKSKTTGFGFDFNVMGQVGAGRSFSTTKSETDSYFLDYNGDGLPDMISNGLVQFNTTSGSNYLDPTFGFLVNSTKNPIESGGVSSSIIENMSFQTMDELREENPQFDHVKIWQAPYSGIITMQSSARIVSKNNDGINQNSFKLTVERALANQVSGILTQSPVLTLQNVSAVGNQINTGSIAVSKGDVLFFRIHNLNHGYGGVVEWNPKITYAATPARPAGQKDENGKIFNFFDAKEDFIINNGGQVDVNSADSFVNVNFNIQATDFTALKFSDDIRFVVRKITVNTSPDSESIQEWSRTYRHNTGVVEAVQTSTGIPITNIPVSQSSTSKVSFEFFTESTSNVDWGKIIWKPTLKGNTMPLVNAPINHRTYDDNISQSANRVPASSLVTPIIDPSVPSDPNKDLVLFTHDFFTLDQTYLLNQIPAEAFPLKVNWVVKEKSASTTRTVSTKSFYIQKNSSGTYTYLKSIAPIVTLNTATEVSYFRFYRTKQQVKDLKDSSSDAAYYTAFYIDNAQLGNGNNSAIRLELVSGEVPNYPGFSPIVLNSPFMAYNPKFYGYSFRSWGQMLYNGGLKFARDNEGEIISPPTSQIYGNSGIDMSLFDFNTQAQTMSDPGYDPENDASSYTNLRYTLYEQESQNSKYANPTIIGSGYYFTSANELVASVGRFAEPNTHAIYVNPNTIGQSIPNYFVGLKQRSESKGKATSGTLGSAQGTASEGESKSLNQYIDLNGDRYPDIATTGHIQYTNMRGALATTLPNANFVSGSRSHDETIGVTIPISPKSTAPNNSPGTDNPTNTNVSSGINVSTGRSSSSREWVDMNGDGLPDKVRINSNDVKVHLNTGYGFTDEITWGSGYSDLLTSERGNASAGISLSFGASFGAGFGAAASTANIRTVLLDVNGDQLPDLVVKNGSAYKYYLNNGKGFDTVQSTFYNDGTMEQDVTVSGNVYGTFTYGVKFKIYVITFKVVGTPTVGKSADYNEKRANVQDIDGDGLPDVIAKGNPLNNSDVKVNLNQVGKTHLLKKVNTALGGSWTVEYKREGNTYDMPHSKWVMTKIQTHDGFNADSNYDLKPSTTLTAVSYENPKYDRRERAFFGYEKVIIKEQDPANSSVFRSMVKSFHTENYYLNGAEKASATYSGDMGQLLSEEQITYNILNPISPVINMNASAANNFNQLASSLDKSRLFVAVARVVSTAYENGQSLSTVKEFTKYDASGNLKTYIDYGEGGEDAFKTEIDYHPSVSGLAYAPGFPSRIRVYKNSGNQLMRERSTDYTNGNGKPTKIMTRLNLQETSTVELEYDNLGNLSAIRNPDNLNESGDVFYVGIEYDSQLFTYPTSVSNAFGEYSTTSYDLLFGIPKFTTDTNGQSMRTRIDSKGRTVEITGPNELALENGNGNPNANGSSWTIRMEYKSAFNAVAPGTANPTNAQHHAVTRHFDPEYANGTINTTNQLLTISIVDGFGQPLQVKKTHRTGATNRWMLSPLEKKDAFGRTLRSYQTGVQNTYPADLSNLAATHTGYYYAASLLANPVEMTYDVNDRVKTVQHPNVNGIPNGIATVSYEIEEGMFVQKTVNEKSQTLNSYTDIRGRNRKTVQMGQITTTFVYNAINELKQVINNEGFVTNYLYDLAGRKTEVQHPDRGVVTFKYDKASRMTEQSTSNLLLAGGQKIKYSYDFGRLTKVVYPDVPQNNAFYTYGAYTDPFAVAERAVGRLLEQKDATGVQVFGYGRMGEVTKNLRSVAVAGYQSYWFYTKWKYDSWNRVKEITYPDQEVVRYHYNTAGSLSRISSQINGISPVQDIITSITYNDYGERAFMAHGNNTNTTYAYDERRRLSTVSHAFPGFQVSKKYTYDKLSNIEKIETNTPQNSLPAVGKIGGPVSHEYGYDTFNRLISATGTYTGANDNTTPYLAQRYSLAMEYNADHTIKKKTQSQWQGTVASYGGSPANEVPVYKNSYMLDYSGYGTGAYAAGTGYGYQQPHAVRSIVESPTWTSASGDDPRIRTKEISYDANGNLTEIKERVGEVTTPLRRNLWDAENRIRAVDLKPDDRSSHPIAIYTYNAAGERSVRYNLDRIDVFSNASKVGQEAKDNTMLYPSGLLMGKAFHDRKGETPIDRISYTKHYYVGSERISAKTGTMKDLGMFPATLLTSELPQLNVLAIRNRSKSTVLAAGAEIVSVYNIFELPPPVLDPIDESDKISFRHELPLDYYYFHPDHLGSSSYITNLAGTVSQHMEYLPFGETLVDEHLNSRNSPFKFNGKELDEETGNYYYGARYYDPKWSIWISVDPLAEKFPSHSPYNYTLNNPINLIDPDGNDIVPVHVYKRRKEGGGYHASIGYEYQNINFRRAMADFTRSCYGENYIKQFLKKDQVAYGVKAEKNGKYSDMVLTITDVNIEGLQDHTHYMGDDEGRTRFSIGEDGKLAVNLFIDSQHSQADQVETITHELALHGEEIDYLMKMLDQHGAEKTREFIQKGDPYGKKDHKALKDNDTRHNGVREYNKIRKELSKDPKIKKAFDYAEKLRNNG